MYNTLNESHEDNLQVKQNFNVFLIRITIYKNLGISNQEL